MRHRRQINETGPVESRFPVSQVKTLLFLGCIGWGHEAKNAFFRDDIETKSVDRSPRHSNRKNETFVQKDDRFERNLRNLYVLERIEKWLKDRRKYFTKIDRTFINRTNKFSCDLSLETGYRRSPLNIKATRDISRDIFLLYGKKKKNRGTSSSSKLNNSFLSCSPSPAWKIHMHGSHRRGSHRATRKQPRLARVGKLEKEPIKGMIYEGRRGEDSRYGSTRDSVSTINRWIISLFLSRRIRRRVPLNRGRKIFWKRFFAVFPPGKRLFLFSR